MVAQIGWVALAVLHLGLGPTFAVAAVLYLIELGGPVMAERKGAGSGNYGTAAAPPGTLITSPNGTAC